MCASHFSELGGWCRPGNFRKGASAYHCQAELFTSVQLATASCVMLRSIEPKKCDVGHRGLAQEGM
jgi:hypothetical protein